MKMGLTFLEVEVGNPANLEVTEKVEFLIDSGTIYSVVPTPILDRLGIKPIGAGVFLGQWRKDCTQKRRRSF
jgi:hypothetical protein